jgi:hypothetical protein
MLTLLAKELLSNITNEYSEGYDPLHRSEDRPSIHNEHPHLKPDSNEIRGYNAFMNAIPKIKG